MNLEYVEIIRYTALGIAIIGVALGSISATELIVKLLDRHRKKVRR